MLPRLVSTSVAIVLLPTVFAKSNHCTIRVHAQANENDGAVFANQVTTPISHKNIYIEKIPSISERDVAAFRVYESPDGTFGAILQLDEHGKVALETLSIEKRGGTLLVFVNGRAVTEFIVDRRISDGQLYIPTGLSSADIDLMRRDWRQIGADKKR